MRIRLRLLLPAIQIVIAVLLLIVGNNQMAAHRGQDVYFGPPANWICYALNAPATVLRSAVMYLWEKLGRPFDTHVIAIDNAIFILGVGLVWFLVGAGIEVWLRKGRNVDPLVSAGPLRLVIDLSLMLLGLAFVVLVGYGTRDLLRMQSLASAITQAALYAIWGLVLLIVYGRDFLHRITAEKQSSTG